MSQMTSAARVGARPLNRPTTTSTPGLRVVTGAPPKRGGSAFGVICATLLAAGLIALLLLNTSLVQGSFTLQGLQVTSDQLTDTEEALNSSLESSKSPASLAARAAAMGMVPARSAAFLRLSDGRIVGVAEPAKPGPGFTVVRTTSTPKSVLAAATAAATAAKTKATAAATAKAATKPPVTPAKTTKPAR